MTNTPLGKPLSKKEVAAVLGISVDRVYTMKRLGQLHFTQIGRREIVYEQNLQKFLKKSS